MANKTDNKTTAFNSSTFREGTGDAVKKTLPVIQSLVEKNAGSILSGSYMIDVEKRFKSSAMGSLFNRTMDSKSKQAMYGKINNLIKGDLALKGGSLPSKKATKDFFVKECVGIGDSMAFNFGLRNNVDDYSLLAMLLALACNGVTNLFTSALSVFDEYIEPSNLRKVLPNLLDMHDGKDALGVLLDLNKANLHKFGGSPSMDEAGMLINFYNKGADTSGTHSNSMVGILDSITPDWLKSDNAEVNMSSVTGKFKYDSAKTCYDSSFTLPTSNVVEDKLSFNALSSLF